MAVVIITAKDTARKEIIKRIDAGESGNEIVGAGYDKDLYLSIMRDRQAQQKTDAERDNVELAILGLISNDSIGVHKALQKCNTRVRYNSRKQRIEYQREGEPWEPPTDRLEAALRQLIALHCKLPNKKGETRAAKFSDTYWNQCINAITHKKTIDPFREWLEALPPWDGQTRLDKWISVLFKVDDKELSAWVSQFIFCGAVTRTYQPGFKLDEIPVIVGAQGVGKSTMVRLALPGDRADWFSDGLILSGDDCSATSSVRRARQSS